MAPIDGYGWRHPDTMACGPAIDAPVQQPGVDGTSQRTHLMPKSPQCDGVGDILMLKNLRQDMKIASNRRQTGQAF